MEVVPFASEMVNLYFNGRREASYLRGSALRLESLFFQRVENLYEASREGAGSVGPLPIFYFGALDVSFVIRSFIRKGFCHGSYTHRIASVP